MHKKNLHIQAGTAVGVVSADGHLIVNPKPQSHYTLSQLLTMSDYLHPQTKEDREWVNNRAWGDELL
jgi:antitoxin component of MazEF toxin-antitoxin module